MLTMINLSPDGTPKISQLHIIKETLTILTFLSLCRHQYAGAFKVSTHKS